MAGLINDQRIWSVKECADIFEKSVAILRDQLRAQGGEDGGMLVWDKVRPRDWHVFI